MNTATFKIQNGRLAAPIEDVRNLDDAKDLQSLEKTKSQLEKDLNSAAAKLEPFLQVDQSDTFDRSSHPDLRPWYQTVFRKEGLIEDWESRGGIDQAKDPGLVISVGEENRIGYDAEVKFDPNSETSKRDDSKPLSLFQGIESARLEDAIDRWTSNDDFHPGRLLGTGPEKLTFKRDGPVAELELSGNMSTTAQSRIVIDHENNTLTYQWEDLDPKTAARLDRLNTPWTFGWP